MEAIKLAMLKSVLGFSESRFMTEGTLLDLVVDLNILLLFDVYEAQELMRCDSKFCSTTLNLSPVESLKSKT